MDLERNVVSTIECACRGEDYSDTFEGFWTGEIDAGGRYVIRTTVGDTLYLFRDEIIAVEEL